MKKKLILFLFAVLALATASYFYIYKNHRNITTESAEFVLTVNKLKQEFAENDSLAFKKYQNKTIEISGKITNIDQENKSITVDTQLFLITIDSIPKKIITNKIIKVKGRFLGYDDLLEEFKLDQATIIE
jgi:hypothetical protein